jgi:hypothetical protein
MHTQRRSLRPTASFITRCFCTRCLAPARCLRIVLFHTGAVLGARLPDSRGNSRRTSGLTATSMVSLQKCVSRSFGCNSVHAVVAGPDYRDQRRLFAMKAATKSIERVAFGWRTCRMLSVTSPILDGQFQSSCQSIRAVPNLDRPNFVVCKLALVKAGTITLIFHTLTKLAASCHGSFINF